MIRLEQLTKSFGTTTVLDHLDFAVASGEIFAVVGPSGAGKSTLAQGVLERAGLITLDPSIDKAYATQDDIVANPKNLSFVLLDFAAQDEFAGQLTIGTDYADTDNIKKLVQAFQDPAVQEFLRTDPSVKNILLPIDAP